MQESPTFLVIIQNRSFCEELALTMNNAEDDFSQLFDHVCH